MNAETAFGPDAPYCASPDPDVRAPEVRVLAGTCDCHAHICGPEAHFAYAEDRIYTPPDALVPAYMKQLQALGAERAVLVQPSVYGTDNQVMLDAMTQMSAAGMPVRGVCVCDDTVTDAELARMHDAGVRGLRFNLVDVADQTTGPPIAGIESLCHRIATIGWHAEFLIHVDDYPEMDRIFADFPVDIVVGHMGYPRLGADAGAEGFQAMLRLAERGRCWIKLTGPYRISAGDLPYPEAGAYARAIVDAAPDRIVWGTDWPHVMVTKAMPNDAALCDLLPNWVADAGNLKRLLVDNPIALYGFAAEGSYAEGGGHD